MLKAKHDAFAVCERALIAEFKQWDYLMEYGGSDPFHADGVNLNLVRNHILYHKHEMEQLMAQEEEEPTLFAHSYPEIYYRPTPDEVSFSYMARADELRANAQEQLALYEQDPNFCYIRDHHHELFHNGETKATRAAGFYPSVSGRLLWYRKYVEQDMLVDMRRAFCAPYEQKAQEWAALAQKMRDYLAVDHSKDSEPVTDHDIDETFADDECKPDIKDVPESQPASKPATIQTSAKPTLTSQIEAAKTRAKPPERTHTISEEQLSIF